MSAPASPPPPRVLALSSSGGHWVQLLRLRPGFEGCSVTFATTRPSYAKEVAPAPFRLIPDCNRHQPFRALACVAMLFWLMWRLRPDVVVTTGALPGHLALRVAKLLGRRTVWIDSVANAEELSMSGAKSAPFADLYLTQWKHLARPERPHYFGNVFGD